MREFVLYVLIAFLLSAVLYISWLIFFGRYNIFEHQKSENLLLSHEARGEVLQMHNLNLRKLIENQANTIYLENRARAYFGVKHQDDKYYPFLVLE